MSRTVSEYEFAVMLSECRSKQEGYMGESFSPIVGAEGNGAIVHYRPSEESSSMIGRHGILLVDSGAQYIDGTTDITRTIALGQPSEDQKKDFTLVLKGHIAVNLLHFPGGTTGSQLDTIARQYLWNHSKDYGHGTGHGVGYFLNVHEGPQSYSSARSTAGRTVLEPGMVTSNEPGYYREGEYGIRIENLVVVEKAEQAGFLTHRVLSLFPIDLSLVDSFRLEPREIDWLNEYHQHVYNSLKPFLKKEESSWLEKKCAII